METNNFHHYIGSKALIAEMHGPEMNDILLTHSCEFFGGIVNTEFSEKPVCIICINPGEVDSAETEFYLDEAKLILKSNNNILTRNEQKDYLKMNFTENRSLLFNQAAEIAWLIKNGYDVGLIPEGKFILTTDLPK